MLLISVGGFWAAFVAYVGAVADSRVDVAQEVVAVAAVVVEDNLVAVVDQLFTKLSNLIYFDGSMKSGLIRPRISMKVGVRRMSLCLSVRSH